MDLNRKRSAIQWSVGHAPAAESEPARMVPATVPGAVQLDWAKAEGWAPYWQGSNCQAYGWMEDVYWTYRATLRQERLASGERLHFVCGGVDYRYLVRLDGQTIYAYEGMFAPFDLDLTGRSKDGSVLEILVFPAPKAQAVPADRAQARWSAKPAVSYGWDFHARLIPAGIWEETYLEIRPAAQVIDAEVRYELAEDLRTARVWAEVTGSGAADGSAIEWTLRGPSGQTQFVLRGKLEQGRLELCREGLAVELWWPHDQGAQPLYASTIELKDAGGRTLESREQRVGFRRVRLVMHPNGWLPYVAPMARNPPPTTVEINGRQIFVKGTNWVPPEMFPGLVTAETYRPLLQLARQANFCLIRCWGGGMINKSSFFEQCDELGLMVWQEFPLSCNLYDGGADYLRVLDQESQSIIRRVRRHACLALWCGGNELFNIWSGMTDHSLAIRLLNRNCYNLDPATPFIPTSPLEGMGHGNYIFREPDGREIFQLFVGAGRTAYTEFGCPGPSPVEYIKTFIPESELWPIRPGSSWQTHHAIGAWEANAHAWLFTDNLRHYFGEAPDLETLVAQGQWLQAEGIRCLFEESRRQKPVCAMALNWCFNEPWPTAANNSLINWPARPKPAFASVVAACRSVLASAAIPKFSWQDQEVFTVQLWLLNDLPRPVPAGRMSASLTIGDRTLPLLDWHFPDAATNTNLTGPEVRMVLPKVEGASQLTLRLEVADHPEWASTYRLSYRIAPAVPPPMIPGNPFGVTMPAAAL